MNTIKESKKVAKVEEKVEEKKEEKKEEEVRPRRSVAEVESPKLEELKDEVDIQEEMEEVAVILLFLYKAIERMGPE